MAITVSITTSPLSSSGVTSKNFDLSEEEFQSLCEALRQGDQTLFERVFLLHFKPCVQYLTSVDRMRKEEAYDATMATMIRFRDLLIKGKIRYGNLRYLLTKMARQTHQQTTKRQTIFTELPESLDCAADEQLRIREEDFDTLARSFRNLGTDCRRVLIEFYYKKRSLKEIAEEEERSAVAVRKQKSRCVATLKRYFHFQA